MQAGRALTRYARAALRMPLEVFADRAAALGYDVERLAAEFGVGIHDVCHRLTAMGGDADGPRFGYLCANAAGTITELRGLPGLNLPRYAAACPLWILYRAQQNPGMAMVQRAVFPSGTAFVFVARARSTGGAGFGAPRHYLTDMIAMSPGDAEQTVYAPPPQQPIEEVGPACRICPRTECRHRVEDPFVS